MEELGLRRVEILGRHVGRQRAAAEGDDAAAKIGDREDDALAEAVEGDRDIGAGDEQAGGDHLLLGDVLARQVLLERRAVGRRIAETEPALEVGADVAAGEIAARRGTGARIERGLEELGGELQNVMEGGALLLALLGLRVARRHGHARLAGQPLDGLGEGEPLGLHDEGEDVAVLAGREIEPLALDVVDEEGGGLLRIEGRQAGELPALLLELHLAPDDRRRRQARADFVEEGVGEAHGVIRSCGAGGVSLAHGGMRAEVCGQAA